MTSTLARARAELNGAWSTKSFAIEYGGYLSNHLAHGIFAVASLGGTREQVDAFARHYATKLEPAPPAEPPVTAEEAAMLVGKRARFPGLVAFYEADVARLGSDAAIVAHLPALCHGIGGSAFHGGIHLGYGFAAGADRVVAEGLAYLNHSNLRLTSTPAHEGLEDGAAPALATSTPSSTKLTRAADFAAYAGGLGGVIAAAASSEALRQALAAGSADDPKAPRTSPFQVGMQALSGPSGVVALAAALRPLPLPPALGGARETTWLVDACLRLFVGTSLRQSCDFFVLHAVTSAWALSQVTPLFASVGADGRPAASAVLDGMHRDLETACVAAYVTQGAPDPEAGIAATAAGDAGDAGKEGAEGEGAVGGGALPSWDDIVASALSDMQRDEHVYKLVHVARERALSEDPNLPDHVYKQAALNVLNLPFRFAAEARRARV